MIKVILTNILIVGLLLWLLSPKKQTKQEEKAEAKAELKRAKAGRYTIEYPWKLKLFMLFGLLFFSFLFIWCLGNELHWWKANSELWVTVAAGLIMCFFLYVVGGVCIWRIKINGDDIAYRNMFGITKHYKVSEIDRIEYKKTKQVFYSRGRKIFTIDDNVPHNYLAYTVAAYREKQQKQEQEQKRMNNRPDRPEEEQAGDAAKTRAEQKKNGQNRKRK